MKKRTLASIKLIYCGILAILLMLLSGLPGLAQGMPTEPHQAPDEIVSAARIEVHKWCPLDLMGGTFTGLCAIAPAPNSNVVFAATYRPSGPENIWRSASSPLGATWERMLNINTASDSVILRLSPNYSSDNTIYVAAVNAERIYVSNNGGYSWRWHGTPGPVVDMAIKDESTIYVALPSGYMAKSTDGALKWPQLVSTGAFDINMLAIDGDTILVGSGHGNVAYSTDAGDSFTLIPEIVGNGNVQVAIDTNYAQNSIIYAGNGNTIYRRALGISSDWEIIRTIESSQQISGLAVVDGVLYGAWYNIGWEGSGAERCIEPTKPTASLEYDTLNVGAEAARFDVTPGSLQASIMGSGVRLWAIDTSSPALMVYDDTLARAAPTLVSPANGTNLNIGTPITFSIKAIPYVNTYEVQYSPDSTFTLEVTPVIITTPSVQTAPQILYEGQYWRARAVTPLRSPWSEVWAIGAQPTSVPVVPVPSAPGTKTGSTVVSTINPVFKWSAARNATGYELQLAKYANMTGLVANMAGITALGNVTSWKCTTTLDYNTTYFWRVRAITKSAGAGYSDWSDVISFTTMAEPAEPPPPAVTPPAPPAPPATTPQPVPVTLPYLWVIIVIGIVLVIALTLLKVRRSSLNYLSSLPPVPAPRPIPMPRPEPVSVLTTTTMEVTAEELCSAYKADNASADAKYKGKILKVTGIVGSVGKDVLHSPYIRLNAGGKYQAWGVRCVLKKEYEPELARLTIGQTVTVQGKCDGRLMNVLMKDCALVRRNGHQLPSNLLSPSGGAS